jgi:hypothetical protein
MHIAGKEGGRKKLTQLILVIMVGAGIILCMEKVAWRISVDLVFGGIQVFAWSRNLLERQPRLTLGPCCNTDTEKDTGNFSGSWLSVLGSNSSSSSTSSLGSSYFTYAGQMLTLRCPRRVIVSEVIVIEHV